MTNPNTSLLIKRHLRAILGLTLIHNCSAIPFAEFLGEATADSFIEHLDIEITGNTGVPPEATTIGSGYWTSAATTDTTTTSSNNIHNSFTFTATGLDDGDTIGISNLNFDYIRRLLDGANPVMDIYVNIDTNGDGIQDGYGSSILTVNDQPTSTTDNDSFQILTDYRLKNGESITFGFSFADKLSTVSRTHLIDNIEVLGYFDFAADVIDSPIARLSGETNADEITNHLLFSSTGHTGSSPYEPSIGTGYWTSAVETTSTSTSNNTIQNILTFTATNLANDETVGITGLNFDYIRRILNGSNPVMDIYINVDTNGDGIQDGFTNSVLTVNNEPETALVTTTHQIPTDYILKNGESISFGFSFADIHKSEDRTHLIDNVVLSGFLGEKNFTTVTDLNNNGASDIWEYQYNATELVANEEARNSDFDGDGVSNIDEARLGTDPRDPSSAFQFQYNQVAQNSGSPSIDFVSTPGKRYSVLGSPDLSLGSWTEDSAITGNGGLLSFPIEPIEGFDRYFYQIEVRDFDNDNDGVSLFEEQFISGFEDNNATSGNGTDNDHDRLRDIILTLNSSEVNLTSQGPTTLYEDESDLATITITRSSPRGNEFLALQYEESFTLQQPRVASNAALPSDYRILDENMNELTSNVVTMAAGVESKTIYIEALPDTAIESDEIITLAVGNNPELNIWISDSEQIDSADYIAISQAGHFLSQASMGGTPETISALANEIQSVGYLTACENWIDNQVALPRETTTTEDCFQFQTDYLGEGNVVPSVNIQNFELIWWGKMVQTKEQFRHRMAFTLSQVFVTSSAFWANQERNNLWRSYTTYYDKLTDAIDFTHRDLLQAISYDPFMGVYLSSAQNRKADLSLGTSPDENYAREVMQLFSCGVFTQDQSGAYLLDTNTGERLENYDIIDITEMAEVFTGLGLSEQDGTLENFDNPDIDHGNQYIFPMQMVEVHHDDSSKILFNGTANEVTIPAGQTGDEDISDALDELADHPSTAPHLTRLFIKRLTNSNPSNAYISRVTEAWRGVGPYGNGERGNFISIFKAILLDSEARNVIDFNVDNNDVVTATPTADLISPNESTSSRGRIKEPILKWIQFYRFAQSLASDDDESLPDDNVPHWDPLTRKASNDQTPDFGQVPMRAPSVFNYYDSEHSPSIGELAEAETEYSIDLTSPESEILSPYVIRQFESFYDDVSGDTPSASFTHDFNGRPFATDYNYLSYLYEKNTSIEDFIADINLWFCNGQVSPALQTELSTITNSLGGATNENFAAILSIIFNSSDFSVSF